VEEEPTELWRTRHNRARATRAVKTRPTQYPTYAKNPGRLASTSDKDWAEAFQYYFKDAQKPAPKARVPLAQPWRHEFGQATADFPAGLPTNGLQPREEDFTDKTFQCPRRARAERAPEPFSSNVANGGTGILSTRPGPSSAVFGGAIRETCMTPRDDGPGAAGYWPTPNWNAPTAMPRNSSRNWREAGAYYDQHTRVRYVPTGAVHPRHGRSVNSR